MEGSRKSPTRWSNLAIREGIFHGGQPMIGFGFPPGFTLGVEPVDGMPSLTWLVATGVVDGETCTSRFAYRIDDHEARGVAMDFLSGWAWMRVKAPPIEVPDEAPKPRRGEGVKN